MTNHTRTSLGASYLIVLGPPRLSEIIQGSFASAGPLGEGRAARASQDGEIQQDFLPRVELAEFAVEGLTRDPLLDRVHLVEPADEVEPVVGACFRTVVAHAPFERRSVPQSSEVVVKVARTCKVVL